MYKQRPKNKYVKQQQATATELQTPDRYVIITTTLEFNFSLFAAIGYSKWSSVKAKFVA